MKADQFETSLGMGYVLTPNQVITKPILIRYEITSFAIRRHHRIATQYLHTVAFFTLRFDPFDRAEFHQLLWIISRQNHQCESNAESIGEMILYSSW